MCTVEAEAKDCENEMQWIPEYPEDFGTFDSKQNLLNFNKTLALNSKDAKIEWIFTHYTQSNIFRHRRPNNPNKTIKQFLHNWQLIDSDECEQIDNQLYSSSNNLSSNFASNKVVILNSQTNAAKEDLNTNFSVVNNSIKIEDKKILDFVEKINFVKKEQTNEKNLKSKISVKKNEKKKIIRKRKIAPKNKKNFEVKVKKEENTQQLCNISAKLEEKHYYCENFDFETNYPTPSPSSSVTSDDLIEENRNNDYLQTPDDFNSNISNLEEYSCFNIDNIHSHGYHPVNSRVKSSWDFSTDFYVDDFITAMI